MRLSTTLTTTAFAYQASARWVAWTPDPVMDLRGGDLARPTQPSEVDDYQVWAPEPTQPPSKAIVDLLLHRRVNTGSSSSSSANNIWENDQTCGWYAGISSKPYVCNEPLACSTKDDVVACATDGLEGFYTVCLNYAAVKSGKCSSVGVQTGCCQDAAQPECGTLVWPGATPKKMFKCFASETIISMIDQPQYILDSSSSAASASSASSASAAAASRSSAEAASRSGNGPSTVIATTTSADGSTSVYTTVVRGDSSASAATSATTSEGAGAGGGDGGDSGGSGTNKGAVAGGIIGGLSLLALIIAFLVWYVMRKKNNKFSLSLCGGKKKTNKEKHVHNKTYNEKNVTTNDKRAYDKRFYDETNAYDQRSRSATPNQTHNQNFHFHIEDDRYDTTPEPRPSASRTPTPSVQPLPSILVTAPSKREQRRQARHQRLQEEPQPQQEPERDLETEEMEQAREQQDYRTHRYHPSSAQRFHDARGTPSPPSLPQPPAPNLDFIGRGI